MRNDDSLNLPNDAENADAAPPDIPAPEQEPDADSASLRQQFDSLQDQHLRLMAEYDNYRKRTAREKDESYANATAAALTRFLPVQDSLERAMAFDHGSDEFAKGFDMIAANFAEILSGFGVTAFGEAGEPFNPELHHAVMHLEDDSLGKNVVALVLQKGYKLGDRVLRYAMVQTAN